MQRLLRENVYPKRKYIDMIAGLHNYCGANHKEKTLSGI